MSSRAPSVLLSILAITVVGCVGGGKKTSSTLSARAPSVASVTGAREEPPSARVSPALTRGVVRVVDGPFTDRVRLTGLRLRTGKRPAVLGRFQGRADVSDLLVLEIRADFYDATGRFVSSGRMVRKGLRAGPQDPTAAVLIAAVGSGPRIVSALVSIPQLVNE